MKRIVIYGAGEYSKRAYEYLYYCGEKIQCFVVSKKDGNPDKLFGIPVYTLREACDYIKDATVYIAISPTKADGLADELRRYDPKQIIEITQKMYHELPLKSKEILRKLPIKNNKILIDCFEGKGYFCNSKYIAQELLKRKEQLDIVWDVDSQDAYKFPNGIRSVVRDSFEYNIEINSARIIICNNSPFFSYEKKQGQFMIDMWHGTGPFKKVLASVANVTDEDINKWKEGFNRVDLFVSNSADNTAMFRDSFMFGGEIAQYGSPRNDILLDRDRVDLDILKQKIGIPLGEELVLYAPTYRKDFGFDRYDLNTRLVLDRLNAKFGKNHVFGYRFHHELIKSAADNPFADFGIDLTLYEDVQEILLCTSYLITDYSSIMWDFSLMYKPVFLYQNDIEDYKNDRNFYWPTSEWPYPIAHTNEELAESINCFDKKNYRNTLEEFFNKDKSYDDGHACERLADRILNVINQEFT